MKLLIAIPSHDFMHVETVKSIMGLISRLKDDGIEHEIVIESGTLVYLAREKLANKAINEKFTHVLWIDADMVFTPDLLEDLMFSGKDFVCGVFHSRRKPFRSCIFTEIVHDVKTVKEYPKDTFEIAACGFAGVLITTEIIEAVKRKFHCAFTPTEIYGEDIAFCWRARQLGYHIFCEPSVRMGHIGHITIYPEDEARWRTEISNIDELTI